MNVNVVVIDNAARVVCGTVSPFFELYLVPSSSLDTAGVERERDDKECATTHSQSDHLSCTTHLLSFLSLAFRFTVLVVVMKWYRLIVVFVCVLVCVYVMCVCITLSVGIEFFF